MKKEGTIFNTKEELAKGLDQTFQDMMEIYQEIIKQGDNDLRKFIDADAVYKVLYFTIDVMEEYRRALETTKLKPPVQDYGPVIIHTVPGDGDGRVPVDTPITATFSHLIDPSTLNEHSFSLKDINNNVVAGVRGLTSDGKTATFTIPSKTKLRNSTTYVAMITGVKDIDGNSSSSKAWKFTTE